MAIWSNWSNWEDQRAAATDAEVPVAVYGLILPQQMGLSENGDLWWLNHDLMVIYRGFIGDIMGL